MSNDDRLDEQLRRAAKRSIESRASAIDVDRALRENTDRLDNRATPRHVERRWLAAVAAAIVVAAGIIAIAWPRGTSGPDLVTTETGVASSPAPSTTGPTTGRTTDTTIESAVNATIADDQAACESEPVAPPSLVDGTQPGDPEIEEYDSGSSARWGTSISTSSVSQSLGPVSDTSRIDDAVANGRVISAGSWQAVTLPVGDPPLGQIQIHLRNTTEGCIRVYFVGPGLYSDEAQSLAEDWVAALASGVPVEPPAIDELEFGYFGRRFEFPGFEIDEFDRVGSVRRTLPDDEVTGLFPKLADGTGVELRSDRSEGRCDNRPLVRVDDPESDPVDPALPEARSIVVGPDGSILAIRDVCPAGTRWGDPGTSSELVVLDPTAQDPTVETLRTWQSDPELIVVDDGTTVITRGERTLADVSPDGRYVSVQVNDGDVSSWNVLNLANDAATVNPFSTCEQAGDIVGPPRFVSDDIVVVARVCSPLHTGEIDEDTRDGDVQVDAIDLAAEQPGDAILWNGSVSGLKVDEFTRTVGLSARMTADGTIWAIVTGNGGLETSSPSYVLHGTEATDITRRGYRTFAFDPADLVTEFDSRPS